LVGALSLARGEVVRVNPYQGGVKMFLEKTHQAFKEAAASAFSQENFTFFPDFFLIVALGIVIVFCVNSVWSSCRSALSEPSDFSESDAYPKDHYCPPFKKG